MELEYKRKFQEMNKLIVELYKKINQLESVFKQTGNATILESAGCNNGKRCKYN
jgi:hypothetical protein